MPPGELVQLADVAENFIFLLDWRIKTPQ